MKKKTKHSLKSISLIFPIYDEEKRILKSFVVLHKFIKKYKFLNFEIILVNDGSKDKTDKLIKSFINKLSNKFKGKLKYITYIKNMGKGYALKKGVLSSTKNWILTCDIDMSVLPDQYLKWVNKNYVTGINKAYFGSRLHTLSLVKAKIHRILLGNLFCFFIYFLFNINLRDTQCGYKLYHKTYIKKIFRKLKENGYVHDIELILLMKKNNILIHELPIKWVHKDDSKLSVISDSFKMFFNLIIIKLRFLF